MAHDPVLMFYVGMSDCDSGAVDHCRLQEEPIISTEAIKREARPSAENLPSHTKLRAMMQSLLPMQ